MGWIGRRRLEPKRFAPVARAPATSPTRRCPDLPQKFSSLVGRMVRRRVWHRHGILAPHCRGLLTWHNLTIRHRLVRWRNRWPSPCPCCQSKSTTHRTRTPSSVKSPFEMNDRALRVESRRGALRWRLDRDSIASSVPPRSFEKANRHEPPVDALFQPSRSLAAQRRLDRDAGPAKVARPRTAPESLRARRLQPIGCRFIGRSVCSRTSVRGRRRLSGRMSFQTDSIDMARHSSSSRLAFGSPAGRNPLVEAKSNIAPRDSRPRDKSS